MSTNKTVISHLRRLEAESIHILREVAAEFTNPVMLYSIGKDSAVMLHLAMKAFYPAKPPFPLMHVDTTWKFREMIEFRDQTVELNQGEFLIVPHGIEHRTAADEEAEVILFEPAATPNTGSAEPSEFTAPSGVRI